jgi:hypothetical protein
VWYIQPDFAALFMALALPSLAAFVVGGIRA